MLEGFGSNCCMDFEGFTNQHQHREEHCAKHTVASLFFPTMEVKPNLKHSSKYLCFLSMATIEMEVS